ncbi:hypothetical protein D3C83_60120 [compost metagenome]
MSGVSLTAGAAGPVARVKDPLRDFLPPPATAVREFAAGGTLTLTSSNTIHTHTVTVMCPS